MKKEKLRIEEGSINSRGKETVRHLYFSLYEQEIISLLTYTTGICNGLMALFDGTDIEFAGRIYYEDKKVNSVQKYCAVVHNHPRLIDTMTVAENLFLTSDLFFHYGFANRKFITHLAKELLCEAGFSEIRPDMRVGRLSTVKQCFVEILRAVIGGKKILVIEGINSAFCSHEIFRLKSLLRYVVSKGISIVFLTERIDDLIDLIDRIIIVRAHSTIENFLLEDNRTFIRRVLSPKEMIKREAMLENDCTVQIHVTDPDIKIKFFGSEVVGLYDQMWRVCPRIIDSLLGKSGDVARVILQDKTLQFNSFSDAVRKGFALMVEPQGNLVFQNMSLIENLTMLADADLVGILRGKRRKEFLARELMQRIGFPKIYEMLFPEKRLKNLEKDIQMVIAIARMLCLSPKLYIFVNPFLNFNEYSDIQFREILERIQELRIPCLILSQQLGQLEKVSDRIISV